MAPHRINHDGGSGIGHIQVYIEILAYALLDIHGKAGSEKPGGMGRQGVPYHLVQLFIMATFSILHFNHLVVQNIGQRRVHIMMNGDVQRIAGLVGVHDVLFVVQTQGVSHYVVEREVHVMGIIGKNVLEVFPDGKCCGQFQLGTDGGLRLGGNFRAYVGDQREGIIQVVLGSAITHILIHQAAAGKSCSQEDNEHMRVQTHPERLIAAA